MTRKPATKPTTKPAEPITNNLPAPQGQGPRTADGVPIIAGKPRPDRMPAEQPSPEPPAGTATEASAPAPNS